jgi:hypothetical protein
VFSAEQLKHFLLGVVLPPAVAAGATWLVVNVPLLSTFFHISSTSVAGVLAQVGTFLVVTVVTWLTQHHVLSAHYTPAAKAAAGHK